MDNNNFMFKVRRLFPSSCQSRTLPDVAETSIKTKTLHKNDLNKPPNPNKVLPISSPIPKLSHKNNSRTNHTSSSNSAWFTSGDDLETDTFISNTSYSGDSFRLKSGRIFRKCEEMKSIDETRRQSYSSDAVLIKSNARKTAAKGGRRSGKTWPVIDTGSGDFSTQMYYNCTSSSKSNRKRRKERRKPRKRGSRSLDNRSAIGESYAVEKNSSDPWSDFRASMVEMIVEKQIFAAEDLERLLLCFLSLNAVSYHGIIFDVFSEICQTLFNN